MYEESHAEMRARNVEPIIPKRLYSNMPGAWAGSIAILLPLGALTSFIMLSLPLWRDLSSPLVRAALLLSLFAVVLVALAISFAIVYFLNAWMGKKFAQVPLSMDERKESTANLNAFLVILFMGSFVPVAVMYMLFTSSPLVHLACLMLPLPLLIFFVGSTTYICHKHKQGPGANAGENTPPPSEVDNTFGYGSVHTAALSPPVLPVEPPPLLSSEQQAALVSRRTGGTAEEPLLADSALEQPPL